MTKFRKVMPDKKPWEYPLSVILNREVTVHQFYAVNTGYGPGFIGVTDFIDENGEQIVQGKVLFSGQVIREQVEAYLDEPAPLHEKFPCELTVIWAKGGQYKGYYTIDADEE